MNSGPSSISIRESVGQLAELLHESCKGCKPKWVGKLNRYLGGLEQAFGAEAYEPMASEFLKEIAQAHRRLISLCAKFHEDGKRLLRQTATVVLVSVRDCQTGTASLPEVRKACALLIDAVKRNRNLQSVLIVEADRDSGGQG